jgi:hypothetical protein
MARNAYIQMTKPTSVSVWNLELNEVAQNKELYSINTAELVVGIAVQTGNYTRKETETL